MALGYTIATILKRMSQVFSDEKLCIKIDKLEQLQRKYVQVQLETQSKDLLNKYYFQVKISSLTFVSRFKGKTEPRLQRLQRIWASRDPIYLTPI